MDLVVNEFKWITVEKDPAEPVQLAGVIWLNTALT